uniref:C-type lectin domain-containing protein n=1 Tax=Astyanax mexicanus TaxID=7994 RepID=A0A8B9HWS7_ASTMX
SERELYYTLLYCLWVDLISLLFMPFRYHFVNINKNWTEAQSYCRQTYTDLATINNVKEMNKLKSTVEGKVVHYAWTGLQKGDGQKWQWSLNDNSAYYNWSSGEPNNAANSNSCVNMYANGKWNDDNCLTSFAFVCYTGKTCAVYEVAFFT